MTQMDRSVAFGRTDAAGYWRPWTSAATTREGPVVSRWVTRGSPPLGCAESARTQEDLHVICTYIV